VNYSDWPADPDRRLLCAKHTFGQALMKLARDYAVDRIPKGLAPEARAAAEAAAHDALYGLMMMLDGVVAGQIDGAHMLGLKLLGEVTVTDGAVVETFELAPSGDELCMGFHLWKERDFGPLGAGPAASD
jgi:hypothetical protein